MQIKFSEKYRKFQQSFGIGELEIPATLVKFFKNNETIPSGVMNFHPDDITLTSCQATRQASFGDAVCLSRKNIGCIAAAITFGLVDQNDKSSFSDHRVYTEIMREQSGKGENFTPPSPSDFTNGSVYACNNSGRQEFALFGKEDSGRFKDVATARKAIEEFSAIQPPEIKAVFFYTPHLDMDFEPDVIVLSLRPVELSRLVQAYSFETGKRIESSMGAVRVVNSDLIVRPYLTQKINVSTYCVGARLIAKYDPDRMGMGIPFSCFDLLVESMEKSASGYPFHLYPGAKNFR